MPLVSGMMTREVWPELASRITNNGSVSLGALELN